jgi:hypothetical protein
VTPFAPRILVTEKPEQLAKGPATRIDPDTSPLLQGLMTIAGPHLMKKRPYGQVPEGPDVQAQRQIPRREHVYG